MALDLDLDVFCLLAVIERSHFVHGVQLDRKFRSSSLLSLFLSRSLCVRLLHFLFASWAFCFPFFHRLHPLIPPFSLILSLHHLYFSLPFLFSYTSPFLFLCWSVRILQSHSLGCEYLCSTFYCHVFLDSGRVKSINWCNEFFKTLINMSACFYSDTYSVTRLFFYYYLIISS